jgi:hypothetical protein
MKEDIILMVRVLFFTEILSFLIGIYYVKKLKKQSQKWFVAYLGIIILFETISVILEHYKIMHIDLFTFFVIPLEFLFFQWLFYQYSTDKEKKRIIIYAITYISAFIIERIFLNNFQQFSFLSFSYTIGNVVLLIIIFQYFFKLINSERILYFYTEHLFWISCGLLLFYLGTSPYYGLFNYLRIGHLNILYGYAYIMYFLNCSMYLLFGASFIWGRE